MRTTLIYMPLWDILPSGNWSPLEIAGGLDSHSHEMHQVFGWSPQLLLTVSPSWYCAAWPLLAMSKNHFPAWTVCMLAFIHLRRWTSCFRVRYQCILLNWSWSHSRSAGSRLLSRWVIVNYRLISWWLSMWRPNVISTKLWLMMKGRSVRTSRHYWLRYSVVLMIIYLYYVFSRYASLWRQLSFARLLVAYFWCCGQPYCSMTLCINTSGRDAWRSVESKLFVDRFKPRLSSVIFGRCK